MSELTYLVKDLSDLNFRYKQLNLQNLEKSLSIAEVKARKNSLLKSGNLIANYHPSFFVPKYSNTQNQVVAEVDQRLKGLSQVAEQYVEKRDYKKLGNLLIPSNNIQNQTILEDLIERIKQEF